MTQARIAELRRLQSILLSREEDRRQYLLKHLNHVGRELDDLNLRVNNARSELAREVEASLDDLLQAAAGGSAT